MNRIDLPRQLNSSAAETLSCVANAGSYTCGVTLTNIEILLAAAISHHQAGHLADADAAYREVLARDPNHAPALHYLGVLAHQRGDHRAAVEMMGRSIALVEAPATLGNLGIALQAQERHEEAIDACRRAIALDPAVAEAFYNLGNALAGGGAKR